MQIEDVATRDLAGRVAKNTGWIIFGQIIQIGIGIFTIAYLARYLGSEGFGKYSFVIAYLGFFGLITDLGINNILVREIARDRLKAGILIGNSIIIKLFLSFLAILFSYIVIMLLKSSFEIKTLIFLAALSFLFSFGSAYRVIFQVDLKMLYVAGVNISDNLIKLGLFIWIILGKGTLAQFILASVVSLLPGLLATMYFSKRFIKPEFKIDFKVWGMLFRESWPLALTAAFIMIYTRIDQLMLFKMKGPQAVGYYAAAVRLVELLNIIPAAFMVSVLPIMSNYFTETKESFVRMYELCFKYLLTMIMPIAVLATIFSKDIIYFIYGDKFLNSDSALAILIWSEAFVFIGFVHYNILLSSGKQRIDPLLTGLSALVNVALNLMLIPKFSFIGASIATLISYGTGVVAAYFLPATQQYITAVIRLSLKPLLASLVIYIFIRIFLFNLLMTLIIALPAYGIFLFLIKGLDNKDIRLAKVIIKGG